jgi:hypothetical protein
MQEIIREENPVREKEVNEWVESVKKEFGVIRAPIMLEELADLSSRRKYGAMLSIIRRSLLLQDIPMRVGIVRKQLCEGVAWVYKETLTNLPSWGTSGFKKYNIDVFVCKEFAQTRSLEAVIFAMAHELCHVLLNAVRHPYREVEEVVDLTAMFMGYGDILMRESDVAEREDCLVQANGEVLSFRYQVGYLSREEKLYAMELFRK